MNDCGHFLDFLFLNCLIQDVAYGIIKLQHSSGEVETISILHHITFNFVMLKMLNFYLKVPSVDYKNRLSYLKGKAF